MEKLWENLGDFPTGPWCFCWGSSTLEKWWKYHGHIDLEAGTESMAGVSSHSDFMVAKSMAAMAPPTQSVQEMARNGT